MAFASNATRNISTKLGLLLEAIGGQSPYSVNTESEFGFKIKGVDLISKNKFTGVIEYQQLKTQKNTLTGSQKGRIVQELSIHDKPLVCASFDLNSWTFSHKTIERIAGNDFWSRIGLPFDTILKHTKKTMMTLEAEYIDLVSA